MGETEAMLKSGSSGSDNPLDCYCISWNKSSIHLGSKLGESLTIYIIETDSIILQGSSTSGEKILLCIGLSS